MIKPQKPSTRLLAFASDSDSDGEPTKKKVSIGESVSQKRQARIIQADALKEDPTIFQYDEVYDEMSANREEAKKSKNTENRESKYISRLLVAADKRKIEYETRIERKVQKEREAEGDKYKDKEVFVTAAYREKLEEMKKAEEAAQREEYLESIGDVRKQKDLSGFYRHFYEQKLGKDKLDTKSTEEIDPAPELTKKDNKSSKRRTYRRHSENENSDEDEESTSKMSKTDGEPVSKKVHLQSNLDADSDFSIDSDSESDDGEKKNEGKDKEKDKEKDKRPTEPPSKVDKTKSAEKIDEAKGEKQKTAELAANGASKKDDTAQDGSDDLKKTDEDKMPPPPPKEIKPKVDVWKKRTVGDVYLSAVKRYYERKQAAA